MAVAAVTRTAISQHVDRNTVSLQYGVIRLYDAIAASFPAVRLDVFAIESGRSRQRHPDESTTNSNCGPPVRSNLDVPERVSQHDEFRRLGALPDGLRMEERGENHPLHFPELQPHGIRLDLLSTPQLPLDDGCPRLPAALVFLGLGHCD